MSKFFQSTGGPAFSSALSSFQRKLRWLAPNILHVGIGAASHIWIYTLAFMPGLEESVIHSARPSSLSAKVLWSHVVLPVGSNNLGATSALRQPSAPLCPLLQRFGLRCGRWIRRSEEFDLIPAFMSIIGSRYYSGRPLKSFGLCLRSDQKVPLELIKQLKFSPNGLRCLANESEIGEHSLQAIVQEEKHKSHSDRFCPQSALSIPSSPARTPADN